MSNVPFLPLAELEKRPLIGKKESGFKVRFKTDKRLGLGLEKEQKQEGEGDVEGEEEHINREPTKIVDKRKMNQVNRQHILDRLRKDSVVKTTDELLKEASKPVIIEKEQEFEINKAAEVGPIKTAKRLVIRGKTAAPIKELEKALDESAMQVKTLEQPEIQVKALKKELEKPEAAIDREPTDEEELANLNKLLEESIAKETVVILEQPKEKPKRGRKAKGTIIEPEEPVDLTTAVIRTQKVIERLPKEREHVIIKAPPYYMNNRKIFIQKLTEMFKPYQQELLLADESASCDDRSQVMGFDLLTHQKIVRDYLNIYTPYRGLLLYHGLGSGKTCTSIAIAEGMKSNKRVFVLTPASLKMNFFSEMKKCGDHIYKKNQFWEFVSIDGKPEYVGILSKALSLSTDYIRKHSGAWLVNINNEPNFADLTTEERSALDDQLNEMIRSKYTDINYNGLNMRRMELLTGGFTHNPFDNAVVVIDEAHNFVSRIVNKIKQPKSIAYILYDYLMNATNVKIVLLSGTPIINYPNEIGVLFNILRGYIKTWTLPISWEKAEKLNTDTILKMLDDDNFKTFDYVDFADNKLVITRNPYGFINAKKRGALKGHKQEKEYETKAKREPVKGNNEAKTKKMKGGAKANHTKKHKKSKRISIFNPANIIASLIEPFEIKEIAEDEDVSRIVEQNPYKGGSKQVGGASEVFDRYNGVYLDETGNINDNEFISTVVRILKNPRNDVTVSEGGITLQKFKALPDNSDAFLQMFVDDESGDAKNINLFQRRILGLTSYFRSAQEQLLPTFVKTEAGDNYHVERIEMSNHQFSKYEQIRKVEADREKATKKQQRKKTSEASELFTLSSTYRIFSRAACNFAFPEEIDRPVPNIKADREFSENDFDNEPKEHVEELDNVDITDEDNARYETRIVKAMEELNIKLEDTNESKYFSREALAIYSPKFAKILENLTNPDNVGLHLLYSHFRTIEGIGIIRLILLANGFAEFKIQKVDDIWTLIENEEDAGKPKFVLYTGTETTEEKEIIRNVYNGAWDTVPSTIVKKVQEIAENNNMGDVIKIFMITSSGAEGINLKNTRFVHIVEPYWHMVRIEQVVGRARRICSHEALPEELRTVKVYLYVATLSELQKTDEKNIELRIRDVSKLDKKTPITTDESLYEIASMKQRINNQILNAVKETAMDCNLYSAVSARKPKDTDEPLVCYGAGKVESNQFVSYPAIDKDLGKKDDLDMKVLKWRAVQVKIGGVDYALNENTNELYNLESYQRAIKLGTEPILEGRLVVERGMMRMERV